MTTRASPCATILVRQRSTGLIRASAADLADIINRRGTTMKVGIIGTGNIGGTLARKLRSAGHEVRIANSRGIEGVRAVANEIGAEPVDITGAVKGVDAVILSIPFPAIANLPTDLFAGLPAEVPVIDTGNYYPGMRDPNIPEIDEGMVESLWVSQQIGRPVIKAFNNILAYSLAELDRPEGASDRLAVAVAGGDAKAKSVACNLVNEVGFDTVDAGDLGQSWRQQPSTPAYCCDWNAAEMRQALAAARPGEAPAKRDRMMETFAALGANPTHADIVATNRVMNAPDSQAKWNEEGAGCGGA
ncbi:NAD(P)-binding domain-containing protein [Paracoccus sp. MBLB3053]|uniref:NAD(P)-binding domain-containing protein n=1 Tax=Paracoccus aurantius TaxID=3073814 RepID=A0ABU2HYW0_9RHOB|nr:NAD(P)-binding domain-containing protein [Paracoccus sp. MBLB3053]MDS9470221.1 NAD(P)-binding domain-containing protein [Paracoccus sp. MBLB3053]